MTHNGLSPAQQILLDAIWLKNQQTFGSAIMMADGDDGGSSGDDGEKDDDQGSSGDDDGDDDKADADKDPKKKISALEEEKDRQYRRRREAEDKAADLEKRLKEIEDKDKDATTKLTEQVQDLTSTNEKLAKELQRSRLENAFFSDNTFTWQNPKAALRLANLDEVEIDKDGKVSGLGDALKKLAEAEPYLLKSEKKDPEPPAKQGSKNGDKNKSEGEADKAKLLKKYPGLAR